jgi:hypothetical protein
MDMKSSLACLLPAFFCSICLHAQQVILPVDESHQRIKAPGVTGPAADPLPKDAVLRIGSDAFSHGTYIEQLALAPERQQVVTIGGNPGRVRVWNRDGEVVRSVQRDESIEREKTPGCS